MCFFLNKSTSFYHFISEFFSDEARTLNLLGELVGWSSKWQPTPVFLPGESHGQRSLADYIVHGVSRVGHDLATKPPPPLGGTQSNEGKEEVVNSAQVKTIL